MKFKGSDAELIREDGLEATASGWTVRESSWPFASGVHFGRQSFWWVVLEDMDGYEDHFLTFCEAWNHARDFREVVA